MDDNTLQKAIELIFYTNPISRGHRHAQEHDKRLIAEMQAVR